MVFRKMEELGLHFRVCRCYFFRPAKSIFFNRTSLNFLHGMQINTLITKITFCVMFGECVIDSILDCYIEGKGAMKVNECHRMRALHSCRVKKSSLSCPFFFR